MKTKKQPERSVDELVDTSPQNIEYVQWLIQEQGITKFIADINKLYTQTLQAERQKREGAVKAERERIARQINKIMLLELGVASDTRIALDKVLEALTTGYEK